MKQLFLLSLLLLQAYWTNANHALGAQLDYVCLGNNQYEITVRSYTDCGNLPLGSIISVRGIPNNCTTPTNTFLGANLPLINRYSIGIDCNNVTPNCFSLSDREVSVYRGILTFPPIQCGWEFRASAPSDIYYLDNVRSNRSAYAWAKSGFFILDTAICVNNSPVMDYHPTYTFYSNSLQHISCGMRDPDGDSLVYRVTDPTTSNNSTSVYGPTYSNASPFSTAQNTFHINSRTGEVSFISTQAHTSILCIAVDEYRQGQLIGSTTFSTVIQVVNANNPSTQIDSTFDFVNGAWQAQGNNRTFVANSNGATILRLELSDASPLDSIWLDTNASNILQVYSNATIQTTATSPTQLTVEINLGIVSQYRNFTLTFNDNHCPVVGLQSFTITIVPPGSVHLLGRLYQDTSGNCEWDIGEPLFANQVIVLRQGTQSWVTRTSAAGEYYFLVDSSSGYTVEPYHNYFALDSCYTDSLFISSSIVLLQKNIPVNLSASCPYLSVDIGAQTLRHCTNNTYHVHYCNQGIVAVDSVYIEVILDPLFSAATASIPIVQHRQDTYRFFVGNLAPNTCSTFTITALLDSLCHLDNRGFTHCTTANIYPTPDLDCLSWTGARLVVEGRCQNDSVSFRVRNLGHQALTVPRNYRIFGNNTTYFRTTVNNLSVGASTPWRYYPATGNFYRAEVDHPVGYPWGLTASASVEGCLDTALNNTVITGLVNVFSMDEGSPFTGMDCQRNVGAYDPNDKQGFPIGYDSLHYIRVNEALKYRIRFQNTGTSYAEDVVLLDTLSPLLDPLTVVPTVSSHAYTWELIHPNVLKVTYDNIRLPDSSSNMAASQGFIDFKIKQQPNNPLGTVIHNTAAIYFDRNPPIITNTTFHTIGENFIVFTDLPKLEQGDAITVTAFPNPFDQATTLRVEGDRSYETLTLQVYNALGQLVEQVQTSNSAQEIVLQRKRLQAGVYFYRLEGDGHFLHAGRLIAQ